jgi:hypothetical protein
MTDILDIEVDEIKKDFLDWLVDSDGPESLVGKIDQVWDDAPEYPDHNYVATMTIGLIEAKALTRWLLDDGFTAPNRFLALRKSLIKQVLEFISQHVDSL